MQQPERILSLFKTATAHSNALQLRAPVVRMRATDADVAVDGGEWTVEVATEMRAATAAVPSQTQQLAEVSGLRWVGETPPAIAIAECEKAEGARAEGGERKRKREG